MPRAGRRPALSRKRPPAGPPGILNGGDDSELQYADDRAQNAWVANAC